MGDRRVTGTRPSRRRPEWATVPNAITLLRLVLVVPVCVLLMGDSLPELTVALLLTFGVSDWVDGYLARRLGQTSKIGALLDPIADRIGVAAITVALVASGHLHLWIALVVAGVDIALLVATLLARPRATPPVSALGKVRTAVLMSGLAFVAVGLLPHMGGASAIGLVLTGSGAVLHAAAGAGYLRAIVTTRDGL